MNRIVFPRITLGTFLFLMCAMLPARAEAPPPFDPVQGVIDAKRDEAVKTIPFSKMPEGIAVRH
ncbi:MULTISPECIES: hypothetical protein [Methylocaldum]|jgi:hypothetical protein|uniref:hypothetical protein n=1 Tax=unclassified Methylocaldum TaxID=2622260 RepID=UPI00098AD78C|nr:hypothetical protein [Methylocaldum sp. 14B]MVF20998.1 hypothetical protein [Methylocaldum sp. BRCS4]